MGGRGILVLAISFAFILGTMLAGADGVFAAKDDEKKTENKEKKEKKVIILYKSDKTDKKDEKGKKHKDKEKHVEKLKGKNVKIKHVYDIIPGIAATVDEDSIVDLMNDEDVLAVVEDAEVHATLLNSIPQINADNVHAAGITGSGVRVCIVDTGVDDSHPALNPLVDEIDYVNDDSDATDDNYHGTHVAGIIASTDSTYRGVAPGASLMAAKVLDENGNGYVSDVVAGIQWCVNNNADVINMSLGYGPFAGGLCETLDAVVSNDAVTEHGVVVIASSGNDSDIDGMGSPSCGSDVISVGAVTIDDVRASFSNGSPKLDVVAPGVSIQSLNLGGSYRTLSGTSMAAPHVSGTAALLLQTDSELTPFEIRTILRDSADDLGLDGFDNLYGHGRINAQAAVDMVNGIAPTPTLYVSAEHSQFDNVMSGPQVIEVIVVDSNLSSTEKVRGEPGVTVNGKILRMIQAVDGNWYGYFADKTMAETADSTSVIAGEGLDFGTFCDRQVTMGGSITGDKITFGETVGVAFPLSVGSGSGSTDNTVPNDEACDSNISGVTKVPNNVVREAKEPNPSFVDPDYGEIGAGQLDIDVNAWPFIQLYSLYPYGNVVIQYSHGAGTESTTLTFDTIDSKNISLDLDKSTYSQNDHVNAMIADVWLNIDPTDEDSWTFGTNEHEGPSTNYQVFDENGIAVGDTSSNTDSNLLTAALPFLMCEDNCVLLLDPNAQNAQNPPLTLFDNENTEILGTNPDDAFSFRTSGGNLDGKIPITFTELNPNSGVFGTSDEANNSILRITNNAQGGTTAVIDYDDSLSTIFVPYGPTTFTILNDATGGHCTQIGIWDMPNLTCTLSANLPVDSSIVIGSDEITFDGNNYNMEGTRSKTAVTSDAQTGITIKNLSITNYSFGIYVTRGNDVTITNNEITHTLNFAIYLDETDNSMIDENTIFDNSNSAIMFFNSNDNNVIQNNSVTQSSGSGMRIVGNDNLIEGNTLTDHSAGLRTDGLNNQIMGNTITDNDRGILFVYWRGSTFNTISENIIQNSQIGISFDGNNSPHENNIFYDNLIQNNDVGIGVKNANYNQFYNNNFISNLANYDLLGGVGNAFNSTLPVGGNFYDNFDEPIEGCDDIPRNGICDATYVFAGGVDSLPWTGQDLWQNPPRLPLPLHIGDASVDEDAGTVLIPVTWNPLAQEFEGLTNITFGYATSDGTAIAGSDYTAFNIILTHPTASGLITLSFPIIDDTTFESDETFTVTLTDPNADDTIIGTSTVTINDNDPQPPTEEFFNLSKNPDSSTDDREFEKSDTVHILIFSPVVDTENMKKAEFKIEDSNRVKLQGKLTLGPYGVYSASVSLGDLNPGTAKVELKLEDNTRQKFQVKENITILGGLGVEPIPPAPTPPTPPTPTEEFYNLSKNPDFSTEDRDFDTSDIIYMQISSNSVDYSNMKKAEFKIQDSKKVKLQGKLTLGPDGVYSASVSLGDLNPGTAKVELKLEDNTRQKFHVKENITIS